MATHALSAFSAIARGMSLDSITQKLGESAKASRLGAHVLKYAVSDGSRIEILYVHPQLIKIVHYRMDGTKMSWVPTQTPKLPAAVEMLRSERGAGKWVFVFLFFLLILPPAGFAAWAWITLHFAYANGERAGYVQKISEKGWLCKTWEGELALMNLPGSMPQVFAFSVRDPAVAQQIMKVAGQRVALHYEQHRGVPTSCFGETGYFVTSISAMPDVSGLPGMTPTASTSTSAHP